MSQQSGLTTQAVASRLAEYRAPVLVMLGDMRTLTETGSMNGQEDFSQNGMCFVPNSTHNMC